MPQCAHICREFTQGDVYTLLRVGARADIKANDGKTALKVAKERLSSRSDQEAKQRYKKVCKGTHTTIDLVKGC